MLDLSFRLRSESAIAADHGYLLYSALSTLVPRLHQGNGIGVHPIAGRQNGDRNLQLQSWSRMTIRTPETGIGELVGLAGKSLKVGGQSLGIGIPEVWPLVPATSLRARLVTIKGFLDADAFLEAARRQLADLGISNETIATVTRRRTLRIKDKEIVGFELLVEALSAEESIKIQEQGVGGRRHMGCGIFVPMVPRSA
ncbi:CRISPR-associated endonuclease Cas6 [Planctomycetes bacterium Pan216]|uniref:CRISPR-associated endonuclease Cas6 n=1 Tax=Kolteria novifilia TaxID=2527975 RepID=A0A518B279_9BACT|nr:CRISPR-associated endonuclease Cas6 [Planctomycetes bacterium Pan216]